MEHQGFLSCRWESARFREGKLSYSSAVLPYRIGQYEFMIRVYYVYCVKKERGENVTYQLADTGGHGARASTEPTEALVTYQPIEPES